MQTVNILFIWQICGLKKVFKIADLALNILGHLTGNKHYFPLTKSIVPSVGINVTWQSGLNRWKGSLASVWWQASVFSQTVVKHTWFNVPSAGDVETRFGFDPGTSQFNTSCSNPQGHCAPKQLKETYKNKHVIKKWNNENGWYNLLRCHYHGPRP